MRSESAQIDLWKDRHSRIYSPDDRGRLEILFEVSERSNSERSKMTGYDFIQYLLETFGAMLLAAILIAFFAYKTLEKYVHSKFDERLGKLEREFQQSLARMNSYHSISQATLEKAF